MAPAVPLPKYHQVYLVLREHLAEGRFSEGLPAELRLVQQFGVARATVRKALERLAAEGLIDRRPGRGTRPREPATRSAGRNGVRRHGRPAGEHRAHEPAHAGERAVVRGGGRRCGRDAALSLPPRARVQKAVRVRTTQQGPLSHITTWVPHELARGFGRRELAREPILLLLERAGVHIGRATQSISACPADATVAARLGVDKGTALLAVERLVYDSDDRPVQWLQGLYRPDRYQYEMQLSRVGGIDAKVWVSTELSAQFH